MIRSLTRSTIENDHALRRDLRLLCWMLRNEIHREGHADVWSAVARLREAAIRQEQGNGEANRELSEWVKSAPLESLSLLTRILLLFFDMANLSEDLHRERVLRDRRARGKLEDSLGARLKVVEDPSTLDALEAEFVFTAHPTEAKRQTVRRLLRRIRETVSLLPSLPRDRRAEPLAELKEDIRVLVRTDPLHPHRPQVLEELGRALHVSGTLWQSVPPLVREVDRVRGDFTRPIQFGCWIGGDRDGHPHVTVNTTRETLSRLGTAARGLHLGECDTLLGRLTVVCRNDKAKAILAPVIDAVPGASERLHPREHYRQAVAAIRSRLRDETGYGNAVGLAEDIARIAEAMRCDDLQGPLLRSVENWHVRARVFGLHLMRLDLRENSMRYRDLLRELLALMGEDPERVDRDDMEGLWDNPPPLPSEDRLKEHLCERSHDLMAVTRLMQNHAETRGPESIGVNVISMTHRAADALWVLWLQTRIAQDRGGTRTLPVVPLFETIDDLQRAGDMLRELFTHPRWREHLAQHDNRQVVMIGYSDSAKDGGYLAACWALHQSQAEMQRVADEAGFGLTCFHGRGGALGRGGGPAARAIEALPPSEGDGHIRMTEQGEVIADRFADPELAHRHMEQILGGLIVHSRHAPSPRQEWIACMDQMAGTAREHYLRLFHHPGFPAYFRNATPIESIETLPIGSRPSRRQGEASLEDLRAIPYTFSWTQSRQLLNAFYGLGGAWEAASPAQRDLCKSLYKEWPFFRSMIDNAELALTKCDPLIAGEYASLAPASCGEIGRNIQEEIHRTRHAILDLTGRDALMAGNAWLRRSVEIRKPFIDVLNHVQIELLRRQRARQEMDEALASALRLSVQGIAAGLRTTG